MTTQIQQYHRLLLEAHQASDAVDGFDLNWPDPTSQFKWQKLNDVSDAAQRHLIAFVYSNAHDILDAITENRRLRA